MREAYPCEVVVELCDRLPASVPLIPLAAWIVDVSP